MGIAVFPRMAKPAQNEGRGYTTGASQPYGRLQKKLSGRQAYKEHRSFNKMEYKVYGLEVMKSPVVLRTAAGEQEFHNGREAGAAAFDRQYFIAAISAEGSRLIVELEENKGFQEDTWADRPVSLFDGD